MKYLHKKIVFIFFWSLLIITFSGCSSIEVSQDYKMGTDFQSLKSFDWKSESQIKTGDVRIDSTLINDRIRMATEKELLRKGLLKTADSTPDFHISYTHTISKKIYSRPVTTSAGYSHRTYPHYRSTSLIAGANVNDYDESLLIIDFLKPHTDIILWRGISTRFYEGHTNPSEATRQIDETIHEILAQFPPL